MAQQIPQDLKVYNTLTRKKEVFTPITEGFVGMYVCGPTVYNQPHIGNARTYVTFDIIFRYLKYLGYTVRYVRNITDVGHLERDADEGEDKVGKMAKLMAQEPMEIAQTYTNAFRGGMGALNNLPPSIEPVASGHITEQIAITKQILDNGLAYISNGSVYFDILAYNKITPYGRLSGRVLEDLLANTRALDGQDEKRNPLDFALWKQASPTHLMKWPSPWGIGFPGWHIECSAMSQKYLGLTFDIHGGGMDLTFPHHECEIAQSQASCHHDPANYWLHGNMITVNGQKMGKSLGNAITLPQFFTGTHPVLTQAYSPQTLRFFYLQAQYRSTLDFSNDALIASGKAYKKVINGLKIASELVYSPSAVLDQAQLAKETEDVNNLVKVCFDALDDDFNTAMCLAGIFNILKKINTLYTKPDTHNNISEDSFNYLLSSFKTILIDILGLTIESNLNPNHLINSLLDVYKAAKEAKDYPQVDKIRAWFKQSGILIKDMKHQIDWAYAEE